MRQIEFRELEIILFLAKLGNININININQLVWVVNIEMKSIRPDYCPENIRVYSVSSRQFNDIDDIPVIVTFFIDSNKRFGELDFWKVNDKPLLCLPTLDIILK